MEALLKSIIRQSHLLQTGSTPYPRVPKKISEVVNPEFFSEHEDTARRGGNIDKIKDNLRILYACKLKSFM